MKQNDKNYLITCFSARDVIRHAQQVKLKETHRGMYEKSAQCFEIPDVFSLRPEWKPNNHTITPRIRIQCAVEFAVADMMKSSEETLM